MQVVAIYTEC